MSIFVFYKWVVKPEKQEEHRQLMQEWREYVKNNPEIYKEMKSWREFTQMFGCNCGSYIWLVEYDSIADYEKVPLKILKDEEAMKFQQNWMQFIDPISLSMDIWNAIE